MFGTVIMAGLVAATTASGAAAAQNTAGDDPVPQGVVTTAVSPVQGRGFRIAASLRSIYDSNILRIGDGVPLRLGDSRADFRFSPAVTAAAGLPVGRQQLFIGADYGRDFYARNTRLDRDRYGIGGGAIWKVGRSCAGSVTGEYKRRQSQLSESTIQIDNVQEIQDYAAVAECSPPIGIGFGGSVTRNVTNNQNPTRRLLDATQDSYDAHLNYGAPVLGQFSAGGSYSRIAYPSRSVNIQDDAGAVSQIGDHVNVFQGRVSFGRSLGTRLSFNISGSYIKVKSDPRNVVDLIPLPFPLSGFLPIPRVRPGYSGPGYGLTFAYHPGPRLDVTLDASRNVTSSPNVGAEFVIRDSILGAANYKLRPSLIATLGASYDRRDYKGSFAVTGAEPLARSRESFTRIFGRLSFTPRPLYAIDLEVAHQDRNSNPSIYNFSSTSAAVTVRIKFGRG